jgi:hypothetical protein
VLCELVWVGTAMIVDGHGEHLAVELEMPDAGLHCRTEKKWGIMLGTTIIRG